MDAEKGSKWATQWNRFILQLVGVWPDPSTPETGIGEYRFLIIILLVMAFMTGPQMVNLVSIWGDIDLMTENLSTANISVFSTVLKMCFIWYHRNAFLKALKPLLSSFDEDWHRQKMADERSTMLKNAIMARKISIGLNVLTQMMFSTFLLLRLAAIVMIKDRTNVDPMRSSLFLSTFPYDNRKSPMFEFTCLGQILTSYTAAMTYTGVDSFICVLIFHVCGQYTNLGEALRRLFDRNIEMKYQDISNELSAIIERHVHLNWFSSTIEKSFNVLLLMQVLGCTVQLCFQGFQILKTVMQKGDVQTFELTFLVLYVNFTTLHLYLYCYVGEMLLVQSSAVGYSAYESRWYGAHPCQTKNILLVMHHSTKPLYLTAGKFTTFCLETFGTILRTSMGYLSVLIAISATIE